MYFFLKKYFIWFNMDFYTHKLLGNNGLDFISEAASELLFGNICRTFTAAPKQFGYQH